MPINNVLKHAEDVIRVASLQVKKDKKCTPDKMRQFAALINSYQRLCSKGEQSEKDTLVDGDPNYVDQTFGG